MAFIVGSLIIGAGASVVGGAIGAKGAKDAAGLAAAGSDREIAFNRESRDLARGDLAPYREAGYTALDALMSMTGLAGTGGTSAAINSAAINRVNAGDYLSPGRVGGSPGREAPGGIFCAGNTRPLVTAGVATGTSPCTAARAASATAGAAGSTGARGGWTTGRSSTSGASFATSFCSARR